MSMMLRFCGSAEMPLAHSGTLVAAFLRADEIALFSDGRVIDPRDGHVHNDWSKVHQLSPLVGMLAAGHYLPSLREDIRKNASDWKSVTVEDIAEITHLVLLETWKVLARSPAEAPKLATARVFVFVAGFDRLGRPRLYYLDNLSAPPFRLQERPLFGDGRDLEIASISTGSGETEDPAGLLGANVKAQVERSGAGVDVATLRTAFDAAKNKLGSANPRIGGHTFAAVIDRRLGFRFISPP